MSPCGPMESLEVYHVVQLLGCRSCASSNGFSVVCVVSQLIISFLILLSWQVLCFFCVFVMYDLFKSRL